MYFDKYFGTLFEIGDPVFFRNKRGIIIETKQPKICQFTAKKSAGYYKLKCHDGIIYNDYHYVFKLDTQYYRDKKLEALLK